MNVVSIDVCGIFVWVLSPFIVSMSGVLCTMVSCYIQLSASLCKVL